MPSAIGTLKPSPSLRTSAGARLIVILRAGVVNPVCRIAARSRSLSSWTAASGKSDDGDRRQSLCQIHLNLDKCPLKANHTASLDARHHWHAPCAVVTSRARYADWRTTARMGVDGCEVPNLSDPLDLVPLLLPPNLVPKTMPTSHQSFPALSPSAFLQVDRICDTFSDMRICLAIANAKPRSTGRKPCHH